MALTKTPIELSSTPGIVDNSNATAITIDSSEKVGIGTSTFTGANAFMDDLVVYNATAGTGAGLSIIGNATNGYSSIAFGDTADWDTGRLQYNHADNSMAFHANSAERMRIGSTGIIYVNGDGTGGRISGDGSGGLVLQDGNGRQSFKIMSPSSGSSQAMTLDASGNVLVGTTSTDTAAVGFRYRSSLDAISSVADGGVSAYFGRRSSFGDIVTLRKDDATVGNIGTPFTGELYIAASGANSSGLLLTESNAVRPMKNGSASDATQDLGRSNGRWKDLYLSGGVYLGGTGAANKLDDYEEGTFTPTIIGATTAGTATYSHQKGLYTKTGNSVTVQIYLNWSGGTGAGVLRVSSLPFALYNAAGFYATSAIGEYSGIAGTAGHTLCGIGLPNTVDIQFAENDFNSAPTTTTYDAAGYIILSMTYLT
jgi:hypothetical protein